jgi:hypothetical protein
MWQPRVPRSSVRSGNRANDSGRMATLPLLDYGRFARAPAESGKLAAEC